ncbi:WD40 repeat domain-containing protein [Zavarzinella formosa]|uniref:WD40 repeat domain-containing protein n=1 Tax=Zavarzinella formosa TaxID=360055 RepID=UPI0012F7D746|nr:hypothetical protein [Zavarzinella formosa]
MALSPDGQQIVVVADDVPNKRNARVISLPGKKLVTQFESRPEDLSFSSDGRAVIHQSGGVRSLPINGGKDTLWDLRPGYRLEVSPNGKYAAATKAALQGFSVCDAMTGKILYSKETTKSGFPVLSNFFDNSQKLATADSAGVITVWNVADGTPVKTFGTEGKLDNCVNSWLAASDDGRYVAGVGNKLCVYEVATERLAFEGKPEGVSSNYWRIGFVPGTHLFAKPMLDDSVAFIDVDSGETKFSLVGHTRAVKTVLFSANGKLAVTMTGSGEINAWDLP